ncbi:hypothetical protein EZS27_000468 [termite gut metagenome]|uniref:Outer membrane protein beta-barrel domain-containing protein n=1 Tax=termite gut metagenome TaxID=433724 RepID=A0A5J4T1C9_9ZZZZ
MEYLNTSLIKSLKNIKHILMMMALMCFAETGFSQGNQNSGNAINVNGIIFEKTSRNNKEVELPVYMANICLLNVGDSSVVKCTTSNDKGYFLLKSVIPNNYLLSFSCLGYGKFYKRIVKDDFRQKKEIDLGRIQMEESSIEMEEVTIIGSLPEVTVKEDTLEYNPAAFQMPESTVVEDLLKRLPGLEVETDGKITVAGKEVRRVFVDGKEFFGRDPKMATKNITINVIDKIQVIDKKSDIALLTGVDDGEEETIINLTIKKGMKKGWMGNVSAGTGTTIDGAYNKTPRYSSNGMISRFLEEDQIALVFNSNNINNQGSTDQGNNARSAMRSSSSGGNGITNSSTIGLNVVDIVSDKLKVGGNIRYNHSDAFVEHESFRKNLLIDSVSYRKRNDLDRNYSQNIAFDTKSEYTPDSLNTIVLSTRISYNHSNSHDVSEQSTLAGDRDSTKVNASEAETNVLSSGWVIGTELTWSRRFEKKGRRLNFTLAADWNFSNGTGTNISTSEFFLRPDRNKYLNQDLNTNSNTNSYNFRTSYIEPVGYNNTLQISYNFRYNKTKNIKRTYDYDPVADAYTILNPDYSKSLDNNFINQTIGLTFNSYRTNYSYTVGLNIVPSHTQSTSFIKGGKADGNDSILYHVAGHDVINYSPQINFRYRFNSNTNLRFDYRGNTRQPSVSQLDPTSNNTNPLNIRTGNPELLPSFSNNISFRLNSNQRAAQKALSANLSFAFTMNEIINFTEYEEETGVQHTMPINENGSWNSSTDIMYTLPLDSAKRFKLSTTTRFSYNNRIGYTMVNKRSERNTSKTVGASENLGLSYSKGWFYGQFRGSVRYTNTSNSLEGKADQASYNFSITYNTQLYLPSNWIFASDFNYMANRGLSSGYNKDELLWNASLSKQFMKQKQASLRLQWNDVLRQRLNVSRSINANYIEDSEYNALTSYFILSFTYRFTTMGKSRGRGERRQGRDNPENNFRE